MTTLQGIHTIQVGDVDLSMLGLGLGHNYFAKSSAVLYDMGDLLRGGLDPNSRMRLMTATESNDVQRGVRPEPLYWKIRY